VATKRQRQQETDTRNVVAAARSGGARKPSVLSRETLKSIIGAVMIFLVIRTFMVEAYHIPSGSMEPTLLVGDFLFVNKVVYGAHVPFTHVNLPGFSDPPRNSVAVYESPSQLRLRPELRIPNDLTPVVVKRLVGTPGDTLYMREGLLYVNGVPQPRPEGQAMKPLGWTDGPDPSFGWQKQYEIGNSRFGPPPAAPTHDDWGPLVIPPAHYFSLGDNRYNSVDARYYGPIPRKNIRGRPMFIYLSIDFDDCRVRWERIGKRIH
jgi:signal peptidase I